jgi:hypothetical protein
MWWMWCDESRIIGQWMKCELVEYWSVIGF